MSRRVPADPCPVEPTRTTPLLLDEMHAPAVAILLRERGHDVVAVAERADLRAMSDADVFVYATAEGRWTVTENIKDLRPLLMRAEEAGTARTGLILTSRRAFPRSRRSPALLAEALHRWLTEADTGHELLEVWLRPPGGPDKADG